MIDFIIGIKGSDFLIFYPLIYVLPVLVLTLVFIELIARKKEEKDIFMDDLNDFDLLILKKLRDKNHIIKYYLLKYFNEGIATLGKSKGSIAKNEKILSYKAENRVERKLKEILENEEEVTFDEIYKDKDLIKIIKEDIKYSDNTLKSKKLKGKPFLKVKYINILTIIVLLPGVMKLFLGIVRGKPIVYLVIELLIIALMTKVIFHWSKNDVSRVGKEYLQKEKNRNLKDYEVIKKDVEIGNITLDSSMLIWLYCNDFTNSTQFLDIPELSVIEKECNEYFSYCDNLTQHFYDGNDCNSCSSCSSCISCSSCSSCGGCGGCGSSD